MTSRRWTRTTLAAVLASGAVAAGVIAANPAQAGEPAEPFRGTYSAAASADGLRVTMTLPAAPLSNTVADVGGPTAQAVLDSNGASQAFASFPYPGANAAVAGGLVKGASNGQIPAPDYPFYVVSYNPTVPEQHVGSGPYTIQARSTGTSSQGDASAGVQTPGVGTVGLAEAKAATDSSKTAVVGSSSSHLTGLAVGPLEIGELVSSASTSLGTDGKLDRKAETRVVAAKVGLTPVVIDGSGVSVGGTPAPAPDTAKVHEALAAAGITVKVFAPEQTQTGIVAPVIRITQTEAKSGATLTYTIGGASAFVQGTPADQSSSLDDALGGAAPGAGSSGPGAANGNDTGTGTGAGSGTGNGNGNGNGTGTGTGAGAGNGSANAYGTGIGTGSTDGTGTGGGYGSGSGDALSPSQAAGLAAGAAFTGQTEAPSSVPAGAVTLSVPDISSPTGAGAGLAAAGPAGTGGGSTALAVAREVLVTRSNATPMLIALTALIAVAMGAAFGVHLLSKEARS